jgi:hypothetical protein
MLTVMRRNGQVMVRYIQALVSQMAQLCKLVRLWLVNFIHTFPNVVTLSRSLLAQTKLNIKLLVALFISQAQSIKVGLILVLHKLGALGQQLVITARKILQHVLALLKRDK